MPALSTGSDADQILSVYLYTKIYADSVECQSFAGGRMIVLILCEAIHTD